MIRLLLEKDPKERLRSACGPSCSLEAALTGSTLQPSLLCYDGLRSHEIFRDPSCLLDSVVRDQGTCVMEDELSTVEGVRTVYERTAVQVPTLRELCLRATGKAVIILAEAIAENGGVRPASPAWMQVNSKDSDIYIHISFVKTYKDSYNIVSSFLSFLLLLVFILVRFLSPYLLRVFYC